MLWEVHQCVIALDRHATQNAACDSLRGVQAAKGRHNSVWTISLYAPEVAFMVESYGQEIEREGKIAERA